MRGVEVVVWYLLRDSQNLLSGPETGAFSPYRVGHGGTHIRVRSEARIVFL